ncbi:MAG: hypothetical protein V7739_06965 [Motiliproteus sp.]
MQQVRLHRRAHQLMIWPMVLKMESSLALLVRGLLKPGEELSAL